jgi:hypothetical protein
MTALFGLAGATVSLHAKAQAQFDVTVTDGAVVVTRAGGGSFAKGATWTLRTQGFQFQSPGIVVTGPDGDQNCAPTPDKRAVSCRVAGYQPGGAFSYKVNVTASPAQRGMPPVSNVFIVND